MPISAAVRRIGLKVANAYSDGEYDRVGCYWNPDRSASIDIAKYNGYSPVFGVKVAQEVEHRSAPSVWA
jgi:hypothetical protein